MRKVQLPNCGSFSDPYSGIKAATRNWCTVRVVAGGDLLLFQVPNTSTNPLTKANSIMCPYSTPHHLVVFVSFSLGWCVMA